MTSPLPPDEARELARTVRRFLEWVHDEEHVSTAHPVTEAVRAHLGEEGAARPVVSAHLPVFEHVNLQGALEAFAAEREVVVHGLPQPRHHGQPDLSSVLHGHLPPQVHLIAPDVVEQASGPGETRACWVLALLLVRDALGPWTLMVRGPSNEDPGLQVEVGGLATADAQEVLRELTRLRSELSVHRGRVLELRPGPGGAELVFAELPVTRREDVVLPEAVLRRIERHSLDVARVRDELRAAGQHLKRGLLLYGPPGTGKTHTTRYVVQHLPGTTVLLLSGRSLGMIGEVADMARALAPSAVVLEDVDLVAEDRGHGPGPSPVLFELLDAMDGSAADADLLFLLTTNRADLLEPALAARPGRVDVAVEVGLPDAEARRRLLEVHSRGLDLRLEEGEVDDAVLRTEGVTASFLKELLRRSVLEALDDGDPPVVTGVHVSRALDDLLDASQGVTRALLGVPADQSAPPAEPVPLPGFDHGGRMRRSASYVVFDDDF